MSKTKRIFAILMTMALAMSMLIASSVASFAAGEVTISVKSGDTHKYEVYQIFTGTVDGTTLSNVKWGQNGTGTVGASVPKTTLDAIEALTGDDATKAAALSSYVDLDSTPIVAELSATSPAQVAPGYYLVKDKTGVTLEDGDEYTLYMVKVAGTVEIERKAGTTESDKKLDDKNDSDPSDSATNAQLTTSSDYDIGDEVPYHVTATISDKVGYYKKYHITLSDVLESGKFDAITLDKSTIKLDGASIANTDDYTVTTTWSSEPSKDGFEVTYLFEAKDGKSLESLAGKKIAINFTAKLGTGAAIGAAGNRNTLNVSYSNNPNDEDSEGETPEKVVITFTYKVVVDKFDEDGQTPLEGAGFTLYKVSKADAEAGVTGADAAAKNAAWASKKLTDSKGEWTTTATEGTVAGKNNRFTFEGIDDGYYVLCETTTPTGYNTLDPKVFKVTAAHGGEDGLTLTDLSGEKVSGEITFTKNVTAGSLTTNIINEKGAQLPETGGIGTIIFYVLGTLLVVGCGIVLISKKRMESK